jgi:NADH-quinone oxidoreductase subunit L
LYGVTVATEDGINATIAVISSILAIGGIVVAWVIWGGSRSTADSLAKAFGSIGTVLQNDYGINALYDRVLVAPVRGIGRVCAEIVDQQAIDGIVNAFPAAVSGVSGWVSRIETGYVRTYATSILFGTILIVLFMIIRGGH